MRKEFRTKLNGDDSRADASAYFTLPFDTRDVWGKAKVPVKVSINGYTWRSTVGNRGGHQYVVVNADARRNGDIRAGNVVTITLEPDTEKRKIEIPLRCRRNWAQSSFKNSTACRSHTRKNSSCGIPKQRRKTRVLAE
jgi:hypothetical protein